MGFPRQEYCSGLPFPSPGHLPNPGIKSGSLASVAMASRFFFTSTTWETPAHSWVWPSDHLCFSSSTLICHIPFLFRDSNYMYVRLLEVFLGGSTDKEPTCQCRRCKRCSFNPWIGKIPWRSKWQCSSICAWKTPWREEPVTAYGSQRVRYDGQHALGCMKLTLNHWYIFYSLTVFLCLLLHIPAFSLMFTFFSPLRI